MTGPLSGRTVLITRPARQMADLADPLEALGAEIYAMPAIETTALLDYSVLDTALRRLGSYDWVVLTSVNGVLAVHDRLAELGLRWPGGAHLAVIGPATADAATRHLSAPTLIPGEYVSEAISSALDDVKGKRFLLARADRARKDLADILRSRGAHVEEVATYRIVAPSPGQENLPERAPDAIALTSSAGVHGTVANLQRRGKEQWMAESALACIGPVTARTVSELGYHAAAVAHPYTIPALTEAIVRLLSARGVAA